MFSYPIGRVGRKAAARLGLLLKLNLDVQYDEEARVLVAVSDAFLPEATFACKGDAPETLKAEIQMMAEDVIDAVLGSKGRRPPKIDISPRFIFGNQ